MSTLDDVLAKSKEALANLQANDDILASIKLVVDANTAQIADLKAQLEAAGQDQTKLDDLAATMQGIIDHTDAQEVAEKALAGTVADNNPAPEPEPAPPAEGETPQP